MVLGFFVLACVLYFRPTQPTVPQNKMTISQGAQPGPGKFYHDGNVLLPNPAISPGMLRPDATEAQVCSTSTREFRHTTEAMKMEVYHAYGVEPHEGICKATKHLSKEGKVHVESCEVDHIVSLELGGADDVRNLFPQPYNPPDGVPGAHAKDALENWLHRQVCVAHVMNLKQAQEAISKDWYRTYLDRNLSPD